MTALLNPHCPINQNSFLEHHQVSLYYNDDFECWGMVWKHGFLGDISMKGRQEACAIAALFVHWWLSPRKEHKLDPFELAIGAYFFHNPERLDAAKLQHTDCESVILFAFVEEQLSLYANNAWGV